MRLIEVNAPVFSRRHVQSHVIAPVDHDSIGTDVYPAFVGIARDHKVIRADIPAAVQLVPARHGKSEQIDIVIFEDILKEWRVADDLRLDGLMVFTWRRQRWTNSNSFSL